MRVTNIRGAADHSCKCGSWLKHWENYGGGNAALCTQQFCIRWADVGAHVVKADDGDSSWYIIPLCNDHDRLVGQEIEIPDFATLVSANVMETCGKG